MLTRRVNKEKTFFIAAAAFGTLALVGPVEAIDTTIPDQEGAGDAERIGDVQTAVSTKPVIALKADTVTVNNGDKFNPSSFVTYVDDNSGILPALNIESNVDMSQDGTYTVVYTAVGHNGEVNRRNMQVNVVTSAEAVEEKNRESASMTILGTDRSNGNLDKIYVSATDPSMYLIKAACSQAEGRIAGYGGVLQCVDVAEWYVVNYLHQAPVGGNGRDIVANVLQEARAANPSNPDIVEVNTWAPGVLVSYLKGLGEYGHVCFINAVSEDGSTAYVTQGLGTYGDYEEYAPVDFASERNASIYMKFCTTRANAIAQGLTIIG